MFKFILLFVSLFAQLAAIADESDGDSSNTTITVDGVIYSEIQLAQEAIKDHSQVYFSSGVFDQGLKVNHNNVILSGQQGTHFKGATIEGKATFVINGHDVTLESIRCSHVEVPHNNGACVRQNGENLRLTNVHFHDSQQGVLSSSGSGNLWIGFSRFERLGYRGRAHGVYSNNEELIIEHSHIIDSVDQGHEIKSRALRTVIRHSTIGSINSRDSRTIDIPNGGELMVSDSIIFQGEKTVNRQLIGYGHEGFGRQRKHRIDIQNNIILLERPQANELLAHPVAPFGINFEAVVKNNVIIGERIMDIDNWQNDNVHYENRQTAQLEKNTIPKIQQLTILKMLNTL